MLGLFVGGEVLACLVYAACVCVHAFGVGVVRECRRGGEVTHDQATMTVMLLSRHTFVSSRMGSWCSDWGAVGQRCACVCVCERDIRCHT